MFISWLLWIVDSTTGSKNIPVAAPGTQLGRPPAHLRTIQGAFSLFKIASLQQQHSLMKDIQSASELL